MEEQEKKIGGGKIPFYLIEDIMQFIEKADEFLQDENKTVQKCEFINQEIKRAHLIAQELRKEHYTILETPKEDFEKFLFLTRKNFVFSFVMLFHDFANATFMAMDQPLQKALEEKMKKQ